MPGRWRQGARETDAEARANEEREARAADEARTLELALEDARRENLRLRDARAAVTHQLGPLPISAAVVAGLVTAFPGGHPGHAQHCLIVAALIVFGVMALVSAGCSMLKPYRKIRDGLEADRQKLPVSPNGIADVLAEGITASTAAAPPSDEDASRVMRWHAAMLELERGVAKGLRTGFDIEWWGLFAVQVLFAIVVVLLIVARLS
jgi:hypothetical protein